MPGTASFDFTGVTVMLTGASGTIGRAIAAAFGGYGARLVLVDQELRQLAADEESSAPAPLYLNGDLREHEFLETVCAVFVDEPTCTVLVNNAALTATTGSLLETTDERWQEIVDVNMRAPYRLCREAIRVWLAENRMGVIVNMSSVGAQRAHAHNAIYDATKGGVDALTRALAVDFGKFGIRANAVAPAAVPSGITANADVSGDVPLRRAGTGADVASAVCFLASDASAFVNGQTLAVDGGILAQLRSPGAAAVHVSGQRLSENP